MQTYGRNILAILAVLLAMSFQLGYAATEIKDIRMWHAPERSRIVFDITEQTTYKVYGLENPARIVIDLGKVVLRSKLPVPADNGPYLDLIRLGHPDKKSTRLVLDIKKPVRYYVQMLKPAHGYQYRLVVDLYDRSNPATTSYRPPKQKAKPSGKRTILIMLDPGHGGEDPGAVGRRTQEKRVVLQIAKQLKKEINAIAGIRAELTRKNDYYIPLKKRTKLARDRNADLFVSIHADAARKRTARGASVYALSQRGATSERARWLANKENTSDLVGGVSLVDKDTLVAGVLLDLSMTKMVSESISFGREVLREFKRIGKVHSSQVEQAAFIVLKSPDIPSILVETAYISNLYDEKLLSSSKHQKKIAKAITRGIQRYLKKRGHLFEPN